MEGSTLVLEWTGSEGDDKAYGLFEQACSVEQSYFAAATETLGTELVIKKYVFVYTPFSLQNR